MEGLQLTSPHRKNLEAVIKFYYKDATQHYHFLCRIISADGLEPSNFSSSVKCSIDYAETADLENSKLFVPRPQFTTEPYNFQGFT
jgi:hypothetical protein